jgi:hypothetical protein
MDKFWSIFAMPIGVLVCFGPVIVLWMMKEWGNSDKDSD